MYKYHKTYHKSSHICECENRSLLLKGRRRRQKNFLTELDWANPRQSSETAARWRIHPLIFALLVSSAILPHSYSSGPSSTTFHNSQLPIPFSQPPHKPLPNCHTRWTTPDTCAHSSKTV